MLWPPASSKLVAERMFGASVVVAQATVGGAGQVQGDVVGRVSERAAEVAGLLVVAEQRERHGGHEANIFQTLAVVCGYFDGGFNGFAPRRGGVYQNCSSVGHSVLSRVLSR